MGLPLKAIIIISQISNYLCMEQPSLPLDKAAYIFNPLRMRRRVTVVCMSVNAQTARVLISAVQTWYYQNRHDTYKVFDSWKNGYVQKLCRYLPLDRHLHM